MPAFFLTLFQPSIQKLVSGIAQDCVVNLSEESVPTDAYKEPTPRIDLALEKLESEISRGVNLNLLKQAIQKSANRTSRREELYSNTVRDILIFKSLLEVTATNFRYRQY